MKFELFPPGNAKHTMMMANSIIGASILSMPYCFKQCGIILGTLVLYLNSVMTKICCHQLIKASLIARRRNYEVLAYDVMGRLGKLWVEMCIIGYLMGCCVAYLVVLGDLGPEMLDRLGLADPETPEWSRAVLMTVVALVCILPLSLLRDIEHLNWMSTVSVAIYLLLVLRSFYEAARRGVLGDAMPVGVELWRMSGIMQCVPIFAMALSCQTQVFEVYHSLPQPSLKTMDRVVSRAIDLCTFIYLGVGIAGYLAFVGVTHITGNVLVAFEPSLVTVAMKVGFMLSIVLSFPLCVLPCRTSIHSLVYGSADGGGGGVPGAAPAISDRRFKAITTLIVVVTLLIGISIPNVEFVLGLVGSTLGTAVCSVAPAWMYLQVAPSTSSERSTAKVVLTAGLCILVLGTAASIRSEEQYATAQQQQQQQQQQQHEAAVAEPPALTGAAVAEPPPPVALASQPQPAVPADERVVQAPLPVPPPSGDRWNPKHQAARPN